MTKRVQQEVIGYLLDALDESERESVSKRLQSDPEYRREWQDARRRLGSLNKAEASGPTLRVPSDLTQRTVDKVMERAKKSGPLSGRLRNMTPSTSPHGAGGWGVSGRGGGYRITWVDLAIVGTIAMIAGLILAPAIHTMRSQARVVACQNNLHNVGIALAEYCQKNHDCFPEVPSQSKLANPGIYAPLLLSNGLLTDPRTLVCPESPLAEVKDFHIASNEELLAADGPKELELKAQLGGSYGYCLDHVEGGHLEPTHNRSRDYFAIMADAPSLMRPDRQSENHGGQGQNVLYEDLHVKFLTLTHAESSLDDIFENDDHQVGPGLQCDDSVIVGSGTPVVYASLR